MKSFLMENLAEFSPDELNEVQGGGLLTNVVGNPRKITAPAIRRGRLPVSIIIQLITNQD
jgi:hypothetical protein